MTVIYNAKNLFIWQCCHVPHPVSPSSQLTWGAFSIYWASTTRWHDWLPQTVAVWIHFIRQARHFNLFKNFILFTRKDITGKFYKWKQHIYCISYYNKHLLQRSYLESVAGKAQAQLPADHHGLHGPPAVAAHCAPHQRAVLLCQDLHTTLIGVTAPVYPKLRTETDRCVLQCNTIEICFCYTW